MSVGMGSSSHDLDDAAVMVQGYLPPCGAGSSLLDVAAGRNVMAVRGLCLYERFPPVCGRNQENPVQTGCFWAVV